MIKLYSYDEQREQPCIHRPPVNLQHIYESFFFKYLSGNVCKSGPLHFGSEKSFPSNFAQETILGHK